MKINSKTKISIKKIKLEYIKTSNYLTWLKNKVITKNLYRPELLRPFSEKSIHKYVKNLKLSKNDFFFMICYDGIPIGTLKIGSIDWYGKTADIGIMIGEKSYWGKGIATLSIKLAKEYSKKKLHLRKLTSGTPIKNIGMIKAFKKNGFKMEGIRKKQLLIDNKYCDHILFGKFI